LGPTIPASLEVVFLQIQTKKKQGARGGTKRASKKGRGKREREGRVCVKGGGEGEVSEEGVEYKKKWREEQELWGSLQVRLAAIAEGYKEGQWCAKLGSRGGGVTKDGRFDILEGGD